MALDILGGAVFVIEDCDHQKSLGSETNGKHVDDVMLFLVLSTDHMQGGHDSTCNTILMKAFKNPSNAEYAVQSKE